jgi:hypothetical protein
VDVSDRAWIVGNAKLVAPYFVAAGTAWDTAISNLLGICYPGVPIDIPPVEFTSNTPRLTLDQAADPWVGAQDWAASIGYALYFTPLGVATIRSELGLAAEDPVWVFDGKPVANAPAVLSDWANLALYDEAVTWDTADANNAVIITGNSSSLATPVQGTAYDLDPDSPTQWGGPFGFKPLFETNDLVSTAGQAVLHRRPIVVDDYAQWEHAVAWGVARGLQSVEAVPLMVGDRSVGALIVRFYTRQRVLGRDEERMLLLLAAQVGPALERIGVDLAARAILRPLSGDAFADALDLRVDGRIFVDGRFSLHLLKARKAKLHHIP